MILEIPETPVSIQFTKAKIKFHNYSIPTYPNFQLDPKVFMKMFKFFFKLCLFVICMYVIVASTLWNSLSVCNTDTRAGSVFVEYLINH